MKKLTLLAAVGVGYVLGTKAGRERYEQIKGTFIKVKDNPRVQETAQQAADFAVDKAPVVKEKVAETAAHLKQSAPPQVQHALDVAGQKAGPVVHQVSAKTAPHRGKIIAGSVVAVVVLVIVRRRRRES